MRDSAVSDTAIARILGVAEEADRRVEQVLDRAERPHRRTGRSAGARQRYGYALKTMVEIDSTADQATALRAMVSWLRALAKVFQAEPDAGRDWLPAYIRESPVEETLAEAARWEKEAEDLEREAAAVELLQYALQQPEIAAWDLPRAHAYVQKYGEAAKTTLDSQLERVRRAKQ